MTIAKVKKLKPGAKVRWNDPAAEMGEDYDCSRDIVVKSVRVHDEGGDEIVVITTADGDSLECLAHELSERR